MPLKLVTIEHGPHPEILNQLCAVVTFPLSEEDKYLIAEMKSLLETLQGVGLAAPQVGMNKQIIIYSISPDAKAIRLDGHEVVNPTVLINPHYTPMADANITCDWEGCFSVSDKTGKVPRYDKIHYYAQSEDGLFIQGRAIGFTARVLQHEIDHIQGILIIQRLTSDCVQGHPEEMLALRIQELNPLQKEMMLKMNVESEKNCDPNDLVKINRLARVKHLLTHTSK